MINIPTKYNDIQFRSRLEAKWAVFFDLMNWKWEYEPFDLDGWLPDFEITSENGKFKTLIEVKPIDIFDVTTATKIAKAAKGEYDLMLLGNRLLVDKCGIYDNTLILGWFLEKDCEWNDAIEWNPVEFTAWKSNTKTKKIADKYQFGFADCIGDFTCRVTEVHSEGQHFLSFLKSDNLKEHLAIIQELQRRWVYAKNRVQWTKE